MKVKIIAFNNYTKPYRAHYNDAGADVFCPYSLSIKAHDTVKIPLGFGLEIPDGYMGLIFPRSSLSSKGITCELPPIDSGYRGEIHAVITNNSNETCYFEKSNRIGQIVILPIVLADFCETLGKERNDNAFGSTNKEEEKC